MERLISGRAESAAVYPGRKQIEIEVRRFAVPQKDDIPGRTYRGSKG